VPMWC